MNESILLVDDDPKVLAALRRTLEGRFSLHCAGGGEQAMGCHLGQGFLFARPMPAADLPSWLAASGAMLHR